MLPELDVVADLDALTTRALGRVLASAEAANAARGQFALALAGGHTPEGLYRALGKAPANARMPWDRTILCLGDERRVPDDDPRSNFGLVRRALLDGLQQPLAAVLGPEGSASDGEAAAAAYEELLRDELGDEPLDLCLLGLGEDGHVASLFPGSPALNERSRWVRAVPAPATAEPPVPRITFSPVPILKARDVLVLVSGAGKAPALTRALAPDGDEAACPARLLRRAKGRVMFLADRAAANR